MRGGYSNQQSLLAGGAPGHQQVFGGENDGQAWTRIRFTDGALLLVHWDGRYEVAGVHGSGGVVTVYGPFGRRLHFPWHSISAIEHQERDEENEA